MSSSDHKIRLNPSNVNSEETQSPTESQKPLTNNRDSAPAAAQNPSSSCQHLSELRTQLGANPFRNLQEHIRILPLGRASIHLGGNIQCGSCGRRPTRLYACVSCAAVECGAHARAHADETSHHVAVDVDRAELFCCQCGDQVYDGDFDAAVVTAAVGDRPPHPPENLRKRRRVDYRPWAPDLKEKALIAENSTPLPTTEHGGDAVIHPPGLRGLCNLGNTCFMNSVLQALLHTPPLRNYFLSDKHNRFYCDRENRTIVTRKSEMNKIDGKNLQLCLACDLDAIFSVAFSVNRTPYSPAKFLYSWWQHASNLATYEQQDAHEFFISMLDGIHEKMKDRRRTHSQGSGDCCIAHRVFSGILRSDVMCTSCGFTSTTYDPCIDISLDLEPNQGGSATTSAKTSAKTSTKTSTKTSAKTSTKTTAKTTAKSSYSINKEAKTMNSAQETSISTLVGCLDRFTRPERLGSDQKIFCQQCKVSQESLKQMSIKKLPMVSCFHIKRFEHSSVRKMSRKIDRYLQFPFSLDMAPYLSSSILKSRYGNRIFPFDEDEHDASSESSSQFELFAVITHSGKLDAGHYVTYLRLSNQWYKCDDAWITQVNDDIVRTAQGYMMFYVQKMLYYRASESTAAG